MGRGTGTACSEWSSTIEEMSCQANGSCPVPEKPINLTATINEQPCGTPRVVLETPRWGCVGGGAAAGSRQAEDAAQLSARFGHSEASDAATGVH